MIIPKDFSNQKFGQNSYKGGKTGQQAANTALSAHHASSFGSIIGDSQVEPQDLSQNPVSRYSENNRPSWQQHQYLESYKSLRAHQTLLKKCPKHGEHSDFDDYKETMALMAAQAHAYAQSCFMYFQLMAKLSKSQEEKKYFQQQQAIAGCMIHGPHGSEPVQLPIDKELGIPPPSLAEFPTYDPNAFTQYAQEDADAAQMPPPHLLNFDEAPEEGDKKQTKPEGEAANAKEEASN